MKRLIYLIPVMLILSSIMEVESHEITGQQLDERAAADTVTFQQGKILIEQNCYSCHTPEITGQQRLAPPIQMVKMHYMRDYEIKEAFVDAIADWVREPNKDKSIMPGALNRFGLMAPIAISEENVRLIADYLYEADLTDYQGHGMRRMRHGGGN